MVFRSMKTSFLNAHHIKIFDYPEFTQQLREQIRENAEHIAEKNQSEIELINKSKEFRKESRIKEILAKRGEQPVLVHIFSAMEPCTRYKPWHDKETGRTFLKYDSGKCLHYYF